MIADYIKVLTADATLLALLVNADANNPKIFPLVAPDGETSPWVVYSYSSHGSGEDVVDEAMVLVSVYAETYDVARQVMNRIIVLLDTQEGAGSIASTDFRFLFSKLVPGGSDTREEDTRLYHFARTFHVKYKRETGG